MKKPYLAIIALLSIIPFVSKAQTWSGSTPGDIYYNLGKVGVGIINPQANLHVFSDDSPSFVLQNNSSVLRMIPSGGINYIESGTGLSSSYADIRFTSMNGVTNWMTIQGNSGKIGIGTTSPSAKLHVENGSALINTDALAGLGGQVTISNNYGNQNGAVRLNFNNGGAVSWIKGIVTGANTNTGSAMVFGVPLNTADGVEQMRLTSDGNLAIGIADPHGYKLAVNGTIHSKEVKVDLTDWADYVFKPTYKLPSLTELKSYIDKNQHLPEVPSEQDVIKSGLNLGEMNKLLMKKVEELTLYLIDQQKQVDKLRQQVFTLTHKQLYAKSHSHEKNLFPYKYSSISFN